MSGFPDNVQRGTSFIWVALHVGLLGGSPLAPSTHTFCRSEETFEQGLWKTPEIGAAWSTPLRFVWPQKSCLWIWGSWALEVASCSQHHTAILRSNGRAVRWWTWSGDSDCSAILWVMEVGSQTSGSMAGAGSAPGNLVPALESIQWSSQPA